MSRRFELQELLGRYVAGHGEIRALREMRALAADPGDVLSAYHYEPGHFTVSAFVTDPRITELVLIHHGRVGAWLQPGGHIEPTDVSLVAAVRREIGEETGLVDLDPELPPLFDIDVHRVPAHGGQPSHRHYDLRFHLVTAQRRLAPPPGGDDVRWAALDGVSELTSDRSVLRSLRKLSRI